MVILLCRFLLMLMKILLEMNLPIKAVSKANVIIAISITLYYVSLELFSSLLKGPLFSSLCVKKKARNRLTPMAHELIAKCRTMIRAIPLRPPVA